MFFFSHYRKPLTVCFCIGLSVFLLMSIASTAIAQESGDVTKVQGAGSIIENAIIVSTKSAQGLDELWDTTFTGSYSPGYLATMDFARKLMVIPFFWLFIPITRAFVFNRYEEMIQHVACLVLVIMLTANNYALTTKISYGLRGFINDTTLTILQQQLGKVSMQDALNDALLTQSARDHIQLRFAECEAKEGQEQLDCFEEGARLAKEEIQALEDLTYVPGLPNLKLPGLTRMGKRLDALLKALGEQRRNGELELGDTALQFANFYFQSAGQAMAQQLIKGFQNAMVTLMDVSLYLAALIGPVAVAASLAPMKPRIFFIWLVGFFTSGLMKAFYNILIGAIATVASLIDATEFGSTGLLIAMGVLSPFIAIAMAGWGSVQILNAMTGGITAIVNVVPAPIPRR